MRGEGNLCSSNLQETSPACDLPSVAAQLQSIRVAVDLGLLPLACCLLGHVIVYLSVGFRARFHGSSASSVGSRQPLVV